MQGNISQGHFHFSKNVFGDVVGLWNNGILVARYEYDAWGNHRCIAPNGVVITTPNHVGMINPIRWRSGYYDSESNLYYVAGRYFDPKLGVVLNSTLDEAEAVGGYAHDLTNPLAVFGNTFSQPAWGYPPLWEPTEEDLEYLAKEYPEEWGGPNVRWWHWVGGLMFGGPAGLALVALQYHGVIRNRTVWRITNAWIGAGVIVGAVALGAATGGVFAKLAFGIAFKKTMGAGLVAGGITGAFNWTATGLATNGFLEMSGTNVALMGTSAFFSGLGGAFGKGFALSKSGKPVMLGAATTSASIRKTAMTLGGTFALTNLVSYGVASAIKGDAPTVLGALFAIITGFVGGATFGYPEILERIVKVITEILKNI